MKTLITLILALASLSQAQIVYNGGRTQWGDSLRWGDSNDSTGYLLARGNAISRDSSGTWVAITTDSCSLPYRMTRGSQAPNSKFELSYEVRTSSGNTDSSQIKLRADSRYCKSDGIGQTCESWVPAGRFIPDTASIVIDTLVTVATTSGTTWRPTRQLFDIPGGTQIRFCADGHQAGSAATDSTFFRRFVIRNSSIPAGGTPATASGGAASSVDVTTFPDNEPFNVAQINGVTPLMGNGVTGTGSQRVTIASDNTAFSVNATLTAGTNTNEVVGDAAHDAAIAGNPIRVGARAVAADYTAVAGGDVADLIATVDGKQVFKPHAIRASTWSYAAASGGITNTTAVTIKAAAAAGIRNCLTGIQVINGHATVSTEVLVRDGAAGTVLHRGWAQAVGGGFAATFEVPLCGTAATLMEVVNVTTGSAVYVNAQGFISAE